MSHRANDNRAGMHDCWCKNPVHEGQPCGNEANWHYMGNGSRVRHERCRDCEKEHKPR